MKMSVLAVSAFVTLSAWAVSPANDPIINTVVNGPQTDLTTGSLPGLYSFGAITEFMPAGAIVNGELEGNPGGVMVSANTGETVHLAFLPNKQVLMTFSLAPEEAKKFPSQLVLSNEEFQALNMRFISAADIDQLYKVESGYEVTRDARRGGSSRARPRRHATYHERRSGGGGGYLDANGRIAGRNKNCVRVVKDLIGFHGRTGDGKQVASTLLNTGRYILVSVAARITGMICSWTGGWHGKGHVGRFDGQCFVPTYQGNCGNPGSHYRLSKCVAPSGVAGILGNTDNG
jgi:hypothetical protein